MAVSTSHPSYRSQAQAVGRAIKASWPRSDVSCEHKPCDAYSRLTTPSVVPYTPVLHHAIVLVLFLLVFAGLRFWSHVRTAVSAFFALAFALGVVNVLPVRWTKHGRFDVRVNGQLLFSKWSTRRLPTEDEITELMAAKFS